MKKYLIPLMLSLVFSKVSAQEAYKAFTLELKSSDKCITYTNGILVMNEKHEEANQLSQLFTIKRNEDHSVLIVSSANNAMFIKRDGNQVMAATFEESDLADYKWNINYAGNGYINLTSTSNTDLSLHVSDGQFQLATPPKLVNSSDAAADQFRFKMSAHANTF